MIIRHETITLVATSSTQRDLLAMGACAVAVSITSNNVLAFGSVRDINASVFDRLLTCQPRTGSGDDVECSLIRKIFHGTVEFLATGTGTIVFDVDYLDDPTVVVQGRWCAVQRTVTLAASGSSTFTDFDLGCGAEVIFLLKRTRSAELFLNWGTDSGVFYFSQTIMPGIGAGNDAAVNAAFYHTLSMSLRNTDAVNANTLDLILIVHRVL
jgi:hypothetical protein